MTAAGCLKVRLVRLLPSFTDVYRSIAHAIAIWECFRLLHGNKILKFLCDFEVISASHNYMDGPKCHQYESQFLKSKLFLFSISAADKKIFLKTRLMHIVTINIDSWDLYYHVGGTCRNYKCSANVHPKSESKKLLVVYLISISSDTLIYLLRVEVSSRRMTNFSDFPTSL